ncbi:MAG: hypothetical protein KGH69_03295 [Candidatus Micrarchaeota archaeon]|nr:hypothetical protein [Candidatus Micrarchaeota archaeon]
MPDKFEYILLSFGLVSFTLFSISFFETTCPIYNTTVSLSPNVTTLQEIGIDCAVGGNGGPVTLVAGGGIIEGPNSSINTYGGAGGDCTINGTRFDESLKVNVTQTGIKPFCRTVNNFGFGISLVAIVVSLVLVGRKKIMHNKARKGEQKGNASS